MTPSRFRRHRRRSPLAALLAVAAASFGLPAAADTLVVANKAEATASLIDLESGAVVTTVETGEGPHEVGISPDGRLALVTNYGGREPGSSLTLIDIPSGKAVGTIDLGRYRRPHGVEWLADNRHALVTAEDNRVLLKLDTAEGKVSAVIETGQEISHMVATTPDGERAFVANIGSGSVSVIDLVAGELIRTLATGEGAEGIDVTPDGRQVWVTNRGQDTVTVIDAVSLRTLTELDSASFPIRARITPDGARVLVTNARSGDLTVFGTAELREERRVSMALAAADTRERLFGDRFGDSSVPIGVVVSGTGDRAWIAHANADVITELDLESWTTVRLLRAGREPDGMGWSGRDAGDGG